ALAVVDVHARARVGIEAVVGAGIEVVAAVRGERIDDAARLQRAVVAAVVGVDVVPVVALLVALDVTVAAPRAGGGGSRGAARVGDREAARHRAGVHVHATRSRSADQQSRRTGSDGAAEAVEGALG